MEELVKIREKVRNVKMKKKSGKIERGESLKRAKDRVGRKKRDIASGELSHEAWNFILGLTEDGEKRSQEWAYSFIYTNVSIDISFEQSFVFKSTWGLYVWRI